jgi:hypothetical protein
VSSGNAFTFRVIKKYTVFLSGYIVKHMVALSGKIDAVRAFLMNDERWLRKVSNPMLRSC